MKKEIKSTLPVSKNRVSKIEKYTAPIEKVKISVNMDAESEPQREVDNGNSR